MKIGDEVTVYSPVEAFKNLEGLKFKLLESPDNVTPYWKVEIGNEIYCLPNTFVVSTFKKAKK